MYFFQDQRPLGSPLTTSDQSTQVNFPVLLRSQQKALKRYATMADIKPVLPRTIPNHCPTAPRPKSLNLTPEITTSRTKLSPLPSYNTLSPRNSAETSLTYTASDVSLNDRLTPRTSFLCSGQFRTVHQSKVGCT